MDLPAMREHVRSEAVTIVAFRTLVGSSEARGRVEDRCATVRGEMWGSVNKIRQERIFEQASIGMR